MINLLKAKKVFKEYVKDYDIENPKIALKVAHIERVSEIAKNTAESLGLSKEDVELAELIGLLHDIGRFEQIKKYNTFIDAKSENHAKLGIDVLFKQGLIRKFIEDDKYDKIIELAIINHNRDKKDIDKNISKEESLHIKLIRDSDKTDILYTLVVGNEKAILETDDMSLEKITDEIYNEFMETNSITYKNRQTSADLLVGHFTYAFDFNFDYGLKIIDDNKYYEELYNRFNFKDEITKERFKNIYEKVNDYIRKRVEKNA